MLDLNANGQFGQTTGPGERYKAIISWKPENGSGLGATVFASADGFRFSQGRGNILQLGLVGIG